MRPSASQSLVLLSLALLLRPCLATSQIEENKNRALSEGVTALDPATDHDVLRLRQPDVAPLLTRRHQPRANTPDSHTAASSSSNNPAMTAAATPGEAQGVDQPDFVPNYAELVSSDIGSYIEKKEAHIRRLQDMLQDDNERIRAQCGSPSPTEAKVVPSKISRKLSNMILPLRRKHTLLKAAKHHEDCSWRIRQKLVMSAQLKKTAEDYQRRIDTEPYLSTIALAREGSDLGPGKGKRMNSCVRDLKTLHEKRLPKYQKRRSGMLKEATEHHRKAQALHLRSEMIRKSFQEDPSIGPSELGLGAHRRSKAASRWKELNEAARLKKEKQMRTEIVQAEQRFNFLGDRVPMLKEDAE